MEYLVLFVLALMCEFVDSGLGMMYGTILSPLLIIGGMDPQVVIPSILLSQGIGGIFASIGHHRHGNANFSPKSIDFKIGSLIYLLGIVSVVIGAFVGTKIPSSWLRLYIGILVTVMGLLVVSKHSFKFSWKKIIGIGVVSAFNKALSGGGYGPLVASGLIISGQKGKNAIGTTDFAEAPICLTAFLVWAFFKGTWPPMTLFLPLCLGAMIGGVLGPYALSKSPNNKKITAVVGWLALALGLACCFRLLKP
jgi:uncharacterized membrane protein YfcA